MVNGMSPVQWPESQLRLPVMTARRATPWRKSLERHAGAIIGFAYFERKLLSGPRSLSRGLALCLSGAPTPLPSRVAPLVDVPSPRSRAAGLPTIRRMPLDRDLRARDGRGTLWRTGYPAGPWEAPWG